MFAAFAFALSTLAAPPDPLTGLRYVCDDPTFIAVLHPAAIWELPMAKPVRDHYPAAKVAVAAGKLQPNNPAADMDATMAYGLARMCQSLDIDSPAEIERIAVSGGSEFVVLATLRRPLDPAKVAVLLPKALDSPDGVGDPVTRRTLGGRPYLRIDGAWTGVLVLDGGRTLVAGPPQRLERVADRAPVPPRLAERVLAGDPLIYFSGRPSQAGTYAKYLVGDAA